MTAHNNQLLEGMTFIWTDKWTVTWTTKLAVTWTDILTVKGTSTWSGTRTGKFSYMDTLATTIQSQRYYLVCSGIPKNGIHVDRKIQRQGTGTGDGEGGGAQWASRPKLRISKHKKKLLTEKIIYLSILGLQTPPTAQKPAFVTNFANFFCKKFLMKRIGGYRKLFAGCRVAWKNS